jgi:hypothetical protein
MLKSLLEEPLFPTHHCITGSLRRIYEHHGYPISEEMLLGLGSGVGFIYWHSKGSDPFYGGRANMERPGHEGLEKTAGRRTGVTVESFSTSSAKKAEKSLLAMLSAGEPVMVYVDMGFLPYLSLPEGYHFGAHTVVVGGYDPEGDELLIADRDAQNHTISRADLAAARGSTYKPFPPRHQWYTFDFDFNHRPAADQIWLAIGEAAQGMLEPPISNFGVKGIRKAAQKTRAWPKIMDEDNLRWSCFNIFIFIDATGGTGGGIFRYMYGRFLEEAGSITGDSRLGAAGQEMCQIGDLWQQVALDFKRAGEAPDPAGLLEDITEPMLVIAGREEAVWIELAELVSEAGTGDGQ